MPEQGDTNLVRQESAMPGLGLLLDETRMQEFLARRFPEHEISPVRSCYARYKPGTSCIVSYRMRVDGKAIRFYARCHNPRGAIKLDNALERRPIAGPLGDGVIVDEAMATTIYVFPNDHNIRAMRVFDEDRRPRRLRRIMPSHPELARCKLKILRYKPERRAVARLTLRRVPRATIRMYPASFFPDARARAWAFSSQGSLRIPTVIGDSSRYCAISYEWIDRAPLTEVLDDPVAFCAESERAGDALASLHRQRPALHSMYTAGDLCSAIESSVALAKTLNPEITERVSSLCDKLLQALMLHPWTSQAVHGDFSPDQVLTDEHYVSVIDFDRAGYGDPLLDIGSFGAQLILLESEGKLAPSQAEACLQHLCEGHRAGYSADDRSVRLFTACALLRLLPEPFRYRKSRWTEKMAGLIERAEELWIPEAVDA